MPNKPVTKTDIAEYLFKNSEKYKNKSDATDAVNSVLTCIEQHLRDGKDISLLGFGKFEVRHRAEREGRNPSTGEKMIIKASNIIGFKAGKTLKNAVNT